MNVKRIRQVIAEDYAEDPAWWRLFIVWMVFVALVFAFDVVVVLLATP